MPAYLKMPDIPGEVEEQNHEEWIEVDSVSMPIFRSITEGAKGAQRRSGETSLGDFVIIKEWDKSSPNLAVACCNGTHMDRCPANAIQGDIDLDGVHLSIAEVGHDLEPVAPDRCTQGKRLPPSPPQCRTVAGIGGRAAVRW